MSEEMKLITTTVHVTPYICPQFFRRVQMDGLPPIDINDEDKRAAVAGGMSRVRACRERQLKSAILELFEQTARINKLEELLSSTTSQKEPK